MPRKRRIQLVGKEAAFNVEAWARAVQALARQLQTEWRQNGQSGVPVVPESKTEDEA
jgi:hypothetical protein